MNYAGTGQTRKFRPMSAPVAGATFAVTLAFMLLLPFVRLSLDGSSEPATLLFLTKTDFGIDPFALVLLLVPVAGVAASLALREHAALVADAILAIVGVIMIPLVALTLGHGAGANTLLSSQVLPGIGMIVVAIMLVALAGASGIAALRSR